MEMMYKMNPPSSPCRQKKPEESHLPPPPRRMIHFFFQVCIEPHPAAQVMAFSNEKPIETI